MCDAKPEGMGFEYSVPTPHVESSYGRTFCRGTAGSLSGRAFIADDATHFERRQV
ncbi:hypothetical protein K525DRAFT_259484, partial [Schizophyllum commune Loenen D]